MTAVHVPAREFNENADGAKPQWASADLSASGTGTLITPASHQSVIIEKLIILNRSTTTGTITLEDGGTQISGIPLFELRTGGFIAIDNVGIKLTEGNALTYTSTLDDAHSIAVKYRPIPTSEA